MCQCLYFYNQYLSRMLVPGNKRLLSLKKVWSSQASFTHERLKLNTQEEEERTITLSSRRQNVFRHDSPQRLFYYLYFFVTFWQQPSVKKMSNQQCLNQTDKRLLAVLQERIMCVFVTEYQLALQKVFGIHGDLLHIVYVHYVLHGLTNYKEWSL